MKHLQTIFLISFLNSLCVFGQINSKEIGFITDNDLYTSTINDRYFTNGLEFFYRYLGKNEEEKINKKINEFRLGQYIYNPKTRNADDLLVNDRPFAGYLFAEFRENFYYQNESVFQKDIQLGVIGPNSYAKEIQEGIHNLFGFKHVNGWQNQIKNTLVVQTHFLFSKKIIPAQKQKIIDFNFQSEVNLGTALTGVSTGFMTRIGLKKLTSIYNSNIYGGSLNTVSQQLNTESELYFYIAPSINYQLYDATIQGGLFMHNSPVTYELIPLRFNGEAGVKYRKNNMNLSYSFVYKGKELQNDSNTGYFYGTILLSFLF